MHTNSTTYYNLPQFVGTDIVNNLTDTNGAYQTIDSTMHDIASAIGTDAADIAQLKAQNGDAVLTTTAQTLSGAVNELDDDLNNATTGAFALIAGNTSDIGVIENTIGDANSGMIKDIGQLQTTVGAQGLAISSLETTVGGNDSGLVKDVADIKAQNGSETLITTAQTLSGAVNELAGQGVQAGNVSYDNTVSELSATNVQSAIDEVNGKVTALEPTVFGTVTGDGVKTYAQLLTELWNAVSSRISDIPYNASLLQSNSNGGQDISPITELNSTVIIASYEYYNLSNNALYHIEHRISTTPVRYVTPIVATSGVSNDDQSSAVCPSGRTFSIVG